jgi:TPR repeat protein
MSWFRKAADQRNPDAQYNMALLYASGAGTRRNLDRARDLMRSAAAKGDDNAKKWLDGHRP